MKRLRLAVLTVAPWLALGLVTGDAGARAKTDLIFLGNGDRITGEITQLDRGILSLKTDGVGTLSIEWDDVDSLYSVYQFRVENSKGEKRFGSVSLSRDGMARIDESGRITAEHQLDIIVMTPVEASFWQQLDGSLAFGLSYTQSNHLGQTSTDVKVRYRSTLDQIQFSASSIVTLQKGADTQQRQDLGLTYSRLFAGPVFAYGNGGLQSNDALGLDLRLLVAPGVGAKLLQNAHNQLAVASGVSFNREWTAGSSEATNNLEAFAGLAQSTYRYDFPKTNLTSSATVYPSLTSWGRVRSEVNISASREIVKDFTFILSFYDSYDSHPPDPSAVRNDFGVVTSIGWTF
jgi:hypothetical protein